MAAKTNMGMVRTNNEDNFQASDNLADGQWSWTNNRLCTLGNKGALMVVADGMGGMNAGEVASEKAIATVKKYFSPAALTDEITGSSSSIEKYLKETIVAADGEIKKESKTDSLKEGMGTTIVMAWIKDDKCYIAWCGDSRAYVYNPQTGLKRLSKDHSYVQELVDNGQLTDDDAFDHPDSNIITRSLGDTNKKAVPELLKSPYCLQKEDIILLCSDGLSGMLHDTEMEQIIKGNTDNLDKCADVLIQAACDAGGHDNITLTACQITEIKRVPKQVANPIHRSKRQWYTLLPALLAFIVGYAIGYMSPHPISNDTTVPIADTLHQEDIKVEKIDTLEDKTPILNHGIKLRQMTDTLQQGDTIRLKYNYTIIKRNQ